MQISGMTAPTIVLASEDISPGSPAGSGGYQLHGLFYSYRDAAAHVAKDEGLSVIDAQTLAEEWADEAASHHVRGVGSGWYTAARQPIRAALTPVPGER